MKRITFTSALIKTYLAILFCTLLQFSLLAQLETYHKLFQTEHFTTCFDVAPTPDQGYVITGFEDRPAPFNMPLVPFLCKVDCRGEVEWMHKYGFTTNIDNTDPRVAVLKDGDYVMMSTVLGTGLDMLVVRTNAAGEAIWRNTYGGDWDDIGRGLLKLDDDNLLVVGNTESYGTDLFGPYTDMYALKISSVTGDTIWTKTFGNPQGLDNIWDVTEAQNGDLTFIGRSFYDNGIWLSLMRTDEDGNVQWIKYYGKTNHQTSGFDIAEMPDGGFVLTGMTTLAKQDFNALVDAFVMRTDIDGNILWAKVYRGSAPDLSDVASTILVKGDSLVVALESTSYPDPNADITKRLFYVLDASNGDLIQATSFNGSGGQFPMIREDWNGYILSGFTDEFPGSWSDPILVKLDKDLNSGCQETDWTFQTQIDEPTWDVANGSYTIMQGAVLSPYAADSLGTNFTDSTLCFTGVVPSDCAIISSTSAIDFPDNIKLFPNPTNGLLHLEWSNNRPQNYQLDLFDLLGRSLLSVSSSLVDSNTLDISDFPAGIYFLQLRYNGQQQAFKVEKF